MSHIHILFTMLIILNIITNRLTASTTSKTSYMLDFNEVFWARGKRGKTRGKLRILNFFCRRVALRTEPMQTRCVVDTDVKTQMHCVSDADYLPTSSSWV